MSPHVDQIANVVGRWQVTPQPELVQAAKEDWVWYLEMMLDHCHFAIHFFDKNAK